MHKIIFEGAELTGKSWIMSQVYNAIEPKHRKSKNILDGCNWFNADNGVFGTENSLGVINGYLKIFEALKTRNIIVEKFILSDEIYQKLHNGLEVDYSQQKDKLLELGFKIVLITFKEDKELIKKRIQDRLNLYPHYEEILQSVDWYINQQKEYKKKIKSSGLPYLIVETNVLPDDKIVSDILNWI